jgi:alkylglycerol monooxygenase
MSVIFGGLFGLLTAFIYIAAYDIAPFKFPADAWWAWVALFFIDDLAYYVFHRVSHEMRLFWNFHVVHHSSEHYNLSVAVRQSWFGGAVHWIFYAPIMLLGFAPWMFALVHGLNLIYQFWIHTALVRRLGWFEYIFNTPSHHRVHHAVNDIYLDKNYAGVLIIWDKLFGSFRGEAETPRYGIIKPVKSFNPLWINTHAWFEMFAEMKRRKSIKSRLKCIFASPNMDAPQTS